MLKITPIPAFSDNYIWCITSDNNNDAIVVDPGCANSVVNYLANNSKTLTGILITHHHADHTGGIALLKQQFKCQTIGFKHSNYKNIDIELQEGESIHLMGTQFDVIEVPGHTIDHIAFYSPSDAAHEEPWLFCGDTLFSGGCGRIFEGTPEQMFESLQKLEYLPANTQICCAHEYTLSNLAFAESLMPNNKNLAEYIDECKQKRDADIPTLPSTLAVEKQINPFLRSDDMELKGAIGASNLGPIETFALTRKAKDTF